MNSVSNLLSRPFSVCSLQEKIEIKTLGRPTPDLPQFIQNIKSGNRIYNRVFKTDLYNKCGWLCGCDIKGALFCFPCLLFGGEDAWTKTGFKDLNHFGDRTKQHEVSSVHIKNSLQLAFVGGTNVIEQLDDVYRRNILAHNKKVKHNRYVLSVIIEYVRFCDVFERALREHDVSNPGVSRRLIDFSAEIDTVLKNHLESATVFRGISRRTVQNELLQMMLDVCQEKIVHEIKEAKHLSIIVDETSGVSHTFQLAVVFRYMVKNKPVERFWGFLKPPQCDATALASCILDLLKFLQINQTPTKLIAQTYDEVMLEKANDVQTIIKYIYPSAHYIQCHDYQLNLIMKKAASIDRNIQIFFANVQGICTFFSSSPRRANILNEVVKKRLSHCVLGDWQFQPRSFNLIFEHKEDITQYMKIILESNCITIDDSIIVQASGYLKTLSSQTFTFWLSFFRKIMPLIETMLSQFQKVEIDLAVVNETLSKFESNILKVKNNIYTDPEDPDSFDSSRSKQKRIDRNEWKRHAIKVCDVVVSHIKELFSFIEHLIAASLFASENFPTYETKFPENNFISVCTLYDFLDIKKFHTELETIYMVPDFRQLSGVVCLFNFLVVNNLHETFSETLKLLQIIITTPMISKPDRCYSTHKRVKTFLRNTMSHDQLSALAMLSIEHDLLMDIPDFNHKVIEKYARLKVNRMDFLYK